MYSELQKKMLRPNRSNLEPKSSLSDVSISPSTSCPRTRKSAWTPFFQGLPASGVILSVSSSVLLLPTHGRHVDGTCRGTTTETTLGWLLCFRPPVSSWSCPRPRSPSKLENARAWAFPLLPHFLLESGSPEIFCFVLFSLLQALTCQLPLNSTDKLLLLRECYAQGSDSSRYHPLRYFSLSHKIHIPLAATLISFIPTLCLHFYSSLLSHQNPAPLPQNTHKCNTVFSKSPQHTCLPHQNKSTLVR